MRAMRSDGWWAQEACDQEAHWDRHMDVPTLIAGGWYDQFCAGSCRYYERLHRQNKAQTRLIMGPWNHGGMRESNSWAGEVDFGPSSVFGSTKYNQTRLAWSRQHLYPTGELSKAEHAEAQKGMQFPVEVFVMGGGDGHRTDEGRYFHGGRWRQLASWPPATSQHVLYLRHTDGDLHLSNQAEAASAATNHVEWTFDPNHPVPTLGGAVVGGLMGLIPPDAGGPEPDPPPRWGDQFSLWRSNFRVNVAAGPMHQQERPGLLGCRPPYPRLADRPDVLSFESAELQGPLEVVGTVQVTLWVSSSCVDT